MMIVQMRKILNAVFSHSHSHFKFALGGSPASGGRPNENRHAEISSGARRPQAASRHKSRCGLKSKDSKKALKC